ncbi:hypothetical protein V8C86DRAFT_2605681 [Haematococcus lacustris]
MGRSRSRRSRGGGARVWARGPTGGSQEPWRQRPAWPAGAAAVAAAATAVEGEGAAAVGAAAVAVAVRRRWQPSPHQALHGRTGWGVALTQCCMLRNEWQGLLLCCEAVLCCGSCWRRGPQPRPRLWWRCWPCLWTTTASARACVPATSLQAKAWRPAGTQPTSAQPGVCPPSCATCRTPRPFSPPSPPSTPCPSPHQGSPPSPPPPLLHLNWHQQQGASSVL